MFTEYPLFAIFLKLQYVMGEAVFVAIFNSNRKRSAQELREGF